MVVSIWNCAGGVNGCNRKTISTKHDKTEIEIPHDRNGTFEPQVVQKYQTKSQNIENQSL